VRDHLDVIDACIGKTDSRTLGLCEVCHEYVETDLLETDYTACVCITHFSEEEVRHLEDQLELAQRVQKTLLPQEAPNIPGLEIAAFSRPAQIVGGDYFDFVESDGGTYYLAIADVAGHGVSASLHMASIQTMLRATVPLNHSPAEVVRQMQKLFIHNIRFTTFVTFFIGAFDPATKTLTYCNAGHNPPMVMRAQEDGSGSTVWLYPTGAALGLVEEAEFAERTLDLYGGDLLVMYTDGVTEAVSPEYQEYGDERLALTVERLRQCPAVEVVRGIREGLRGFSAGVPPADDTTVVVCKVS
jgi:sigma-B regulation protein RsbU (phosphoserine phosphatase)